MTTITAGLVVKCPGCGYTSADLTAHEGGQRFAPGTYVVCIQCTEISELDSHLIMQPIARQNAIRRHPTAVALQIHAMEQALQQPTQRSPQ